MLRRTKIIVYGTKGDTGPTWCSGSSVPGAAKAKVYHGGFDDWTAGKHPLTNEAAQTPGGGKFTAKSARTS